jgi:hypothetical protein
MAVIDDDDNENADGGQAVVCLTDQRPHKTRGNFVAAPTALEKNWQTTDDVRPDLHHSNSDYSNHIILRLR